MEPQEIIGLDLAREIASLSRTLRRQIGLLLNRRGDIEYVIVGDHGRIVLPDLKRHRVADNRLRSLRLVHTHLKNEPLSEEDLSDMLLLRLDLVAVVQSNDEGVPTILEYAHMNPAYGPVFSGSTPGGFDDAYIADLNLNPRLKALQRMRHALGGNEACLFGRQSILLKQPDFTEMMRSLEEELARNQSASRRTSGKERALIVHVCDKRDIYGGEVLQEMHLLARSSGVEVVDVITQYRNHIDPAFVLGRGKLSELTVQALCKGVTLLLFSCDLNPTQVNHLAEITDLKVVDRTQLILDIFARRATSSDGKLQVELAQLKYLLPRLVQKDTAMSRLMGGIGGRGPGESKLEIDRRRARERINRLEHEIKHLSELRERKRALRQRGGMPLVALVGYTNVGKSTLFNLLCGSSVYTEDAAFATLDPTSRRLRLPTGREIILMDTVGFIRDLPGDLVTAFRATLEEIQEASLILHVTDIAHEDLVFQMESVERLLDEMGCDGIPQLRVLNKSDLVSEIEAKVIARKLDAVPVSALDRSSMKPLLDQIAEALVSAGGRQKAAPRKNS